VIFLDRSRRADHRLEWKVRAFTVAAVLGVGGIYFEQRWMTGVAIAVLLGGMFVRFGAGAGEASATEGGDEQREPHDEQREQDDEQREQYDEPPGQDGEPAKRDDGERERGQRRT
jgi:hypothetical protein